MIEETKKGNIKGGPRKGQKYRPRKPYEEVECPHCGAGGKGNVMFKWHFDNCKWNPGRLNLNKTSGEENENKI
jgi:hypothetical protein